MRIPLRGQPPQFVPVEDLAILDGRFRAAKDNRPRLFTPTPEIASDE